MVVDGQPVATSTTTNAASHETDMFERTVQSYIQGLKRGALRENTFFTIVFDNPEPVVTPDGVDYVYRIRYYDIPSQRWVESTERVRGDFNGNLLEAQYTTRIGPSPVPSNTPPDNWVNTVYDRSVHVSELGIDLVVFSGEHVSGHNTAGVWTKYKLFLQGPGSGRAFLRLSGMRISLTPWFLAARTSLSSALLFAGTILDITAAANGMTPELAVRLSQDASGWVEISLQAMKLTRLAGPLGIFTLGFTIGYEVGVLAGLGFAGRIYLGLALGFAFVVAVIFAVPVLPFILIAAGVTILLIVLFKYLGW